MFDVVKNYAKRTVVSPSPAERRWLRVMSTLNEYQARLFVAEKALDGPRWDQPSVKADGDVARNDYQWPQ